MGTGALAAGASADVLIAPERPPHHNRAIRVGDHLHVRCWYRPYGGPGDRLRVRVYRHGRRLAQRRIRCRRSWHAFRVYRTRRPGRYVMRLRGGDFRGYRIVTRVRRFAGEH